MRGAKSKLTKEMTEKLCAALRAGNTRRAACLYAGISTDSFSNYLRDNSAFSAAVIRAEGDAEVAFVAVIKKCAMAGNARAAQWWLAHHPNAKADWRETRDINWRDISAEQLLLLAGDGPEGVDSSGDRLATAGAEGE